MGSDQSTAIKTQQQYQQFIRQYSKERNVTHPQFGDITVYDHTQTNDHIFIRKFISKSDTEFNTLSNHLKKRKQYDQQNLIRLIAVRTISESQMCGDSTQVGVVFEYFEDSLEAELKTRKNNQQLYSESHLWILIQQIVDACAYLEEQKQVHGDLRPSQIYLDANGQIKLAEYNMIPGCQPGFQKMLLNKDKAYLSPLLLQAYADQNYKVNHNQIKSDVYSFGLTLLSSILLDEQYDCLNFSTGQIESEVIEGKLKQIKTMGYSQVLVNFIRELLQHDESNRPTFKELEELINQFRDKIYNLQPFYQQKQNQPLASMVISKSILGSPTRVYQPIVRPVIQPVIQPVILQSPQRVIQYSPQRMPKSVVYKMSPKTERTNIDSKVQKAMNVSNEAIRRNKQ